MPRNEDGEFELVFGNRQLLSIFFIVVFLLGIFFVMGYIVGRNSTPGPTIASNKPAATDTTETVASQQPSPSPNSVAASIPADSSPSPIPAAAPPEQKPAASQATEASRTPAKARADSGAMETASAQPAAGEEFLQVVAVAHPDAEVIVDTLQKRGFRARIAPGPSEKIFRVLVGPVKDAADMGKLRSQLEAAGFKPIVRKY